MLRAADPTAGVEALVEQPDLAHALGMETTAEGVEDNAQLAELRSHGCSSVQGFLFAKPMQAKEVARLFRDEDQTRNVA